jgi:hypothetical protein
LADGDGFDFVDFDGEVGGEVDGDGGFLFVDSD